MAKFENANTEGIDHVGLTVPDLAITTSFFTDCLGWEKFGGNPAYPSAYVTDGQARVTLWQAQVSSPLIFDRKSNIGLHHLAFRLTSIEVLDSEFKKISVWPGVRVEFVPELSGKGPKVHFMIYEPGGVRLEFSYDPRSLMIRSITDGKLNDERKSSVL